MKLMMMGMGIGIVGRRGVLVHAWSIEDYGWRCVIKEHAMLRESGIGLSISHRNWVRLIIIESHALVPGAGGMRSPT